MAKDTYMDAKRETLAQIAHDLRMMTLQLSDEQVRDLFYSTTDPYAAGILQAEVQRRGIEA